MNNKTYFVSLATVISLLALFILPGCSNSELMNKNVPTPETNRIAIRYDSCINNTKDNPQCKDCCDCLPGVDSPLRTRCRDACAAHDFTKNNDFITVTSPSSLGQNGDYSACVAQGSAQCKYCCENTLGLQCGDYRFCRTACNDKLGDTKNNISPKKNQTTSPASDPQKGTGEKKPQGKSESEKLDVENSSLDSSSAYISGKSASALLALKAPTTLLGRPEDHAITFNVLATPGMSAVIAYGTTPGIYTKKSGEITSPSGEPIIIPLTGLDADTEYYYRTEYNKQGEGTFALGDEGSFHTQRTTGESFVFVVQADPHMDGHSEPAVYTLTLQNEASDHADFIIDLGDLFMTEKFAKSESEVVQRYIEQRAYLDIIGKSTPLFLVNGNHEGEFGWLFNSINKDNDASWALKARKTYYLNPLPDEFYTGSQDNHNSYYAWHWGAALFVVLDPYSYSTEFRKQTGDMWDSTIGDEQYAWFKTTLETSKAKYKFVFIHHMLGEFRGMTSWADKYEWGGQSQNGAYDFPIKRPHWEMPIHDLMVKNNVTILFQGHDHLFSKEMAEGIIYQEIAQPSTAHGDPAPGTEGAYAGDVLTSPGYMRITVTSESVKAEYVKTYLPGTGTNKAVAYEYTVKK